jgi:toxin ParE1/3/4
LTAVEFQPAAESDLLSAWLQVAEDRGVDAAEEYISRIRDLCSLIASQPGMGVARPEIAENIQSFPVDSYVIYYEQHDSSTRILRVWHTAQDPVSFAID